MHKLQKIIKNLKSGIPWGKSGIGKLGSTKSGFGNLIPQKSGIWYLTGL